MQRSRPVIEFVNHASFVLEFAGSRIITDPWLFGTAFNDGWSLLCDYGFDPERFAEIDCIWMSHEHPDHFSPAVLRSVPEALRRDTTVLFQQTKDRKVIDFCAEIGYRTRELRHMEPVRLDNGVEVVCGQVPLYDSWILYDCGGFKVMNINDCAVDGRALAGVRRVVGPIDVLFTQFSYAGWKGGPGDTAMRRAAARAKLRGMQAQIRALEPRWTVPFASFSYFSHHENRHSNDSINRPSDAAAAVREAGSEPVVMYPGDRWTAGDPWANDAAFDRYRPHYNFAAKSYLTSEGVDEPTLLAAGRAYVSRIRERNSLALLWLVRRVPLVGLLRPVTVYALDLDATYRFSLEHGLQRVGTAAGADVKMHSSSLHYLLRHEWGYDTLAVNGRFEAGLGGFSKMKKTFSIGSLNNAGRRLSVGLLFDRSLLRMVWSAAQRLRRVGA
ncbi:MAG: hypothetical protein F4X28_14510 [Acidimicrobiaceae bacterium]|nr:hypothetical protein [Acidimicrobiaceae bacterium]